MPSAMRSTSTLCGYGHSLQELGIAGIENRKLAMEASRAVETASTACIEHKRRVQEKSRAFHRFIDSSSN